jgi:hypothetical protein
MHVFTTETLTQGLIPPGIAHMVAYTTDSLQEGIDYPLEQLAEGIG